MPHIHLRTTADLRENTSIPDILEALVAALAEIESIEARSIKAYHSFHPVWAVGAGARPGFASCSISLLAGRPEELRSRIADRLYGALQAAFAESVGLDEVSLTLEVREMNRATYRK